MSSSIKAVFVFLTSRWFCDPTHTVSICTFKPNTALTCLSWVLGKNTDFLKLDPSSDVISIKLLE